MLPFNTVVINLKNTFLLAVDLVSSRLSDHLSEGFEAVAEYQDMSSRAEEVKSSRAYGDVADAESRVRRAGFPFKMFI